jgi:hypothetical protein
LVTSLTVTVAAQVDEPQLSVTVKVTVTGVPILEQLNVLGETLFTSGVQEDAPLEFNSTSTAAIVAPPDELRLTVMFLQFTEGA